MSIDEIRTRWAAATPGNRRALWCNDHDSRLVRTVCRAGGYYVVVDHDAAPERADSGKADATAIAAAPTDIATLLELLDAERAAFRYERQARDAALKELDAERARAERAEREIGDACAEFRSMTIQIDKLERHRNELRHKVDMVATYLDCAGTVDEMVSSIGELRARAERAEASQREEHATLREVAHALGICHCWDYGCEPGDRDSLVRRAAELTAAEGERDDLRRHYDAAAPEHNLLALLDHYMDEAHRLHTERCAACDSHREDLDSSKRRGDLATARAESAEKERDALRAEVERLRAAYDAQSSDLLDARRWERLHSELSESLKLALRMPHNGGSYVEWATEVRNAYDTLNCYKEREVELRDKALRFDLDAAGIESRERDAVELVQLRADLARANAAAAKHHNEANAYRADAREAREELSSLRAAAERVAATWGDMGSLERVKAIKALRAALGNGEAV